MASLEFLDKKLTFSICQGSDLYFQSKFILKNKRYYRPFCCRFKFIYILTAKKFHSQMKHISYSNHFIVHLKSSNQLQKMNFQIFKAFKISMRIRYVWYGECQFERK